MAPSPKHSVLWYAPFLNHSGYGEEARGFLRELSALEWRIAALSSGNEVAAFAEQARHAPEMRYLREALERVPKPPVIAVLHLPGYAVGRVQAAAASVARTMFETDGLPATWVDKLNTLDEVWVPSSFNVETFRRAGVRVPIAVVPGGVDSSVYRPGLEPLEIPGVTGTVFLAVFVWSHRKAPDVILRAWADAFSPEDQVTLVLRASSPGQDSGDPTDTIETLVDQELARLGTERSNVAPIVVLGSTLPTEDMPRLYASADVFVGVSRGEGWGRPLLEAMACGLPTIGTRWSGNLEFMTDDNSVLVDIEQLSVIDDRMEIPSFRGQRWAEPSCQGLAVAFRRLAFDRELRESIGERAREDVASHWTWEHAARVATARLEVLSQAASATKAIRWVGDFYADTGFAQVNRDMCLELASDRRFEVQPKTAEHPPYPRDHKVALAPLLRKKGAERPNVEVRHAWPPDFTPTDAEHLVVMQPWEFGGIPRSWVHGLEQADEVWVPTSWLKESYVRSGIPSEKVAVVPYGVDVSTFSPDGPSFRLRTDKTFRLLFVGGAIHRKGFDLLLDAYAECFDPDDDVCLVVKPFGKDGAYAHMAMDERAEAMAADPASPAVEIVHGRLTKHEMASLYRACDVLVHPYRGEGFGLPVAEAMACGLPTVVTGYGACLDFCDAKTSWLLPARIEGVSIEGLEPTAAGFWLAQPDRSALVDTLRMTLDPDARKQKGAAARRRIEVQFSTSKAAGVAAGRLAELTTRPPTPPSAPVAPGVEERLDTLATLTSRALGQISTTLQGLVEAVGYLEREALSVPRGTNPVPRELLTTGPDGRVRIGFSGAAAASGYRGFEDVFRGTEAEIRRRRHFYLPYLDGQSPVLDVGCGRGEMLEVLADAGIAAVGIDLDETMVARAREKGLAVELGECRAHLAALPAGSLGAVFSAQVVEHLDKDMLEGLLREALRALRPGGVAILETVNPHCAVGRKNFWLDLTHVHPIFPEVLCLLTRDVGFSAAEVVFPGGTGELVPDLLGRPDYAVIARR